MTDKHTYHGYVFFEGITIGNRPVQGFLPVYMEHATDTKILRLISRTIQMQFGHILSELTIKKYGSVGTPNLQNHLIAPLPKGTNPWPYTPLSKRLTLEQHKAVTREL